MENINETMLVIQDGMIKYSNIHAATSFGYSEQEIKSIAIFELIHPEDREEVTKRYLQKINGDNPMAVASEARQGMQDFISQTYPGMFTQVAN